jgi:hypothetical protein
MATPQISTRSITWSVITKVKPRKPSEFQSVLLAIAGPDSRQPLQVIQGAHEFLGRGVRTTPERRQLRSGQSVIDRLRDQLNELVAVIQFRAHPKGVKLTSVRGGLCCGPRPRRADGPRRARRLVGAVSLAGMKRPRPRVRLIEGFSQGWIDFDGSGARRKGAIVRDAVIAGLVNKQVK